MLLNTIAEKHPNSFVLLLPKTRDEQNRVRDWQVLNTSRHYDKIQKVAKQTSLALSISAITQHLPVEYEEPPEQS